MHCNFRYTTVMKTKQKISLHICCFILFIYFSSFGLGWGHLDEFHYNAIYKNRSLADSPCRTVTPYSLIQQFSRTALFQKMKFEWKTQKCSKNWYKLASREYCSSNLNTTDWITDSICMNFIRFAYVDMSTSRINNFMRQQWMCLFAFFVIIGHKMINNRLCSESCFAFLLSMILIEFMLHQHQYSKRNRSLTWTYNETELKKTENPAYASHTSPQCTIIRSNLCYFTSVNWILKKSIAIGRRIRIV